MMRTLRKISFVGYLLVALGVAANGILYMTAKEIMSYHQIAMGVPWGQLSDGMQIMSLNFMKSAGVGFVTTGVSILLLALFPFRRGNKWADYAIPLVASVVWYYEDFLLRIRYLFGSRKLVEKNHNQLI